MLKSFVHINDDDDDDCVFTQFKGWFSISPFTVCRSTLAMFSLTIISCDEWKVSMTHDVMNI